MSRFVSAGTNEEEVAGSSTTERDEAWSKAQRQIDAARQQASAQKPRPGEQEDGKSLYETLQANKGDYAVSCLSLGQAISVTAKAAKQEAFEEASRLKNQFRSLDDDEVEFLDSVLESTRAKEAEVKRETRDQLDAFRQLQNDAEKAAAAQEREGEGDAGREKQGGGESWSTRPRKRKKGREGILGGVKIRRTSTAEKQQEVTTVTPGSDASPTTGEATARPSKDAASLELKEKDETSGHTKSAPAARATESSPAPSPSPPPALPGLGLAAYSSDEDD